MKYSLRSLIVVTLICVVSGFVFAQDRLSDDNRSAKILATGTRKERLDVMAAICTQKNAGEATVAALVELADHKEVLLRRWAVVALGHSGSSASGASCVLVNMLKDRDRSSRIYAALALCDVSQKDSRAAVPVLMEALWCNDPEIQVAAAERIGRLGPEGAIALPHLLVVLQFNSTNGIKTWKTGGVRIVPGKSLDDEGQVVRYAGTDEEVKASDNVVVRRWDFLGTDSMFDAPRKAALLAIGRMNQSGVAARPFVEAATTDSNKEVARTARTF